MYRWGGLRVCQLRTPRARSCPPLTLASFSEGCGVVVVVVVMVGVAVELVAGGGLEGLRSEVVVVAEGAVPFPAVVLVDVALTPAGKASPADCASFTTSRVFCSAITILESGVGAHGSTSERCTRTFACACACACACSL